MSPIQLKREEYNSKVKEINHLLAENVNNKWNDDLQAKHDLLADDADRLASQIEAMEKAEQRNIQENFKDIDDFRMDDKEKKVSDGKKGLDIFLRKSVREMTAEDALIIRNTMSTTTNSEGGYTVQSDVAAMLIEAIKEYRYMRQEASQITTEKGNPLSYPTTDGTSETGEWVAQNTAATLADISFGTVPLNVFKAGSKTITVPIELLQDSQIDIQALVFNRAAQRIGRLSNTAYTVGTGTGQPNGFVTAASVGVTAAAGQVSSGFYIYNDFVDLIDSLDYGYQAAGRRLCFMGSQSARKAIRKLKDSSNRPIWTPSYDAGIQGGYRDQLLGYDFCVNNDMAVPAASAKSLAFGDFSQYMIRDAMEVSIFRFDDSAFMSKGQVGYLAWARTGGNLLDTGAIKLFANAAT